MLLYKFYIPINKKGGETREMDLREEVLKRCDIAIKEMENSNCSSSTKEHSIARSQASKQILEIICGIQEINVYTAMQILKEAESIISDAIIFQKL